MTEPQCQAARLPLSVIFRGQKYVGEYEISGGRVRVFFEGRNKTTKLGGSSNPEFLARLLLIELVCGIS